jgi:heme-degrading monooxygenase HmoA
MVFVNMATLKPRDGGESDLAEIMKGFRDAMRGQAGWVGTYLLKERGQGRLVGISIWETEAAFEKSMENVRPPPSKHPPESLRDGPPSMQQLDEI